jgi:type IV pilus assembly protein PilE
MTVSSPARTPQFGYTIVELMVVVAIIAVIASIAIPAYVSHIRETEIGTARMNMLSLQTYIEDFRLENGGYAALDGLKWTHDETVTTLTGVNALGDWNPDGDAAKYDYSVEATANSYDLLVVDTSSDAWVRCEARMTNCCSSDTAGATTAACP